MVGRGPATRLTALVTDISTPLHTDPDDIFERLPADREAAFVDGGDVGQDMGRVGGREARGRRGCTTAGGLYTVMLHRTAFFIFFATSTDHCMSSRLYAFTIEITLFSYFFLTFFLHKSFSIAAFSQ